MNSRAQGPSTPMANIRVLNLGTQWPGRLAAMMLADQGADVVEIVRPGREKHTVDPLLDRGKRLWEADLKDDDTLQQCRNLATGADIVLENMRPGAAAALGLDYGSLDGAHHGLIYVSMPGFAEGDPRRDTAAWEGVIDASTGVYTNISPLGPLLGGDPVYSAIPMASAYGGVLAALAASLGLYGRQQTGRGQSFEVPLADAVMSAMALLICKIEGQPSRYNFPTIDNAVLDLVMPTLRDLRGHMSDDHVAQIAEFVRGHANPTINFYDCADGRVLFVCAPDHVYQNRAFLQVLGVYDRVIAEGMVSETPYKESDAGNNINKGATLTPAWRVRLIELISAAALTKPAKEWEALMRDANVPASMVQTTSEWLADPVHFEAGVTTDIEDPERGTVRQTGRYLSILGDGITSPDLKAGETVRGTVDWKAPAIERPATQSPLSGGLLDGIKVLDFSNIVAGPAAGRTLAEHGADVVRIDPPAPQAGPFATMWFGVDVNQGKRAIVLDLKSKNGKATLERLVKQSDVVLHNFLDRSAISLGISHDQLKAINPEIISCQISAWAGSAKGAYDDDPSFDPVLQSATGIMARYGGSEKRPVMHAIASCVDYITGYSAALGITQALMARAQGKGGAYVKTSLAMAAQLVQFPHMVSFKGAGPGKEPAGQGARGENAEQHLYELVDGWTFIGCRHGDGAKLAKALGAKEATVEAIAAAVKPLRMTDVGQRLAVVPGAGVAPVKSLAEIREDRTVEGTERMSNWMSSGSFRLFRGPHPSGHTTTLPMPTWIRPESSEVRHLQGAPLPGAHTVEVLAEAGHSEEQIDGLVTSGTAHHGWRVLPRYLPN